MAHDNTKTFVHPRPMARANAPDEDDFRVIYKQVNTDQQIGEVKLDLSGFPTGLYHGRIQKGKTTLSGKINYIGQ